MNREVSHIEKRVGMAGFEPATSCSQSRRDNRPTLHPVNVSVKLVVGWDKYKPGSNLLRRNLHTNPYPWEIMI